MFLLDSTVVVSASDITQAGICEFAFLRKLDAKLGRDVVVPRLEDSMLERAADLGDEHEELQLQRYRDEYGTAGVVEIDRPTQFTFDGITERAEETTAALSGNSDIIFQATFFDPNMRPSTLTDEPNIAFIGFADFLLNISKQGNRAVWQVQDTKLARKARVPALLQLAAYGEQITRLGFDADTEAVLLLGDASRSVHKLAEIAPVYRSRRQRLYDIILESWKRGGADRNQKMGEVTRWGDSAVHACGRCEVCEPEVQRTRDPLLVSGMRLGQRNRLIESSIETIDALAAVDLTAGEPLVAGMSRRVLERLVEQARVQTASDDGAQPVVRVMNAAELTALPQPNEGDLFFDFEGDPLYKEDRSDGTPRWGIDYLFGMVDTNETFTAFWAHNLEEERQALIDFLALVEVRRRKHPRMHIYHYAPYERTHLLSIAARHGVGESAVDGLLRDNVLVDLYPVVKKALRVGVRSYSIKKLEPLYMGEDFRDEDGVTDGAQSVAEYAAAALLRHSPDQTQQKESQKRLNAIGDYNRYDCVSTLRLRDWLLEIAFTHGIVPIPQGPTSEDEQPELEVSSTGLRLLKIAEAEADPLEARAWRLAASAIDYHQREQKSFWWAHFARLVDPIEDWADTRDVIIVEDSVSRVLEDWHKPPRARTLSRFVELRGTIAPGSSLKEDTSVFAVYEQPAPFTESRTQPGARASRQVTITERLDDGVVIKETLPHDTEDWDVLPIALTPGPPPPAGSQKAAIEEWGDSIADAYESTTKVVDPVFDLMRRIPPRLLSGNLPIRPDSQEALSAAKGDESARTIGAVTATLRELDRSYVAVQGPPGTGKTYLASHVMKRLVEEDGWRIGVVAQSHKVVENVLDGVIEAGLDSACVGKVPQGGKLDPDTAQPEWTALKKDGHAAFLSDESRSGRGAIIGGTAWDFSNLKRFDRKELDLIVIDEAGQFSLAPTIAAAVASQRILLLGDPQQLPQVSQGNHPEPIDSSALGWLIDDHDTLPESLGYFLAETRRMRPELAEVDSTLSYEGRLHAHPSAAARQMTGVGRAGVIWHPVDHVGNATFSKEEADTVVQIATDTLTGSFTESGTDTRPLTERDIIVVAAYNAQVECVTQALADANLHEIRVGTVDKFQGQEAAIAIVTLAASTPEDVPRGLEFLLMRNRLNVAISRAQWAAHLVSSQRLGGTGLPASAAEVTALSGYLFLTEEGQK